MTANAMIRVRKYSIIAESYFALFFTKNSIVGVKTGGALSDPSTLRQIGGGTGGMIGATVGAWLGEGKLKGIKDKIEKLGDMSNEDLLKLDKNNFELNYNEIDSVEMSKSNSIIRGPRAGYMKIKGKKILDLDITPEQDFGKCKNIVAEFLPKKLTVL